MSKKRSRPDGRRIRPDDLVKRVESVVYAEIDDALVMLDLDVGRYYRFDPVAKRVWNLIQAESSVAAVREVLTKEFAVDGQTCLRDLLAFVARLQDHGLVRVRPADGQAGA